MKESFSINQLTNGGFVLAIGGREYRFSELRMKDYGRLESHLKRIQPKAEDAVLKAAKELKFAAGEAQEAILKAYERDIFWPVSVDSPPGLGMIQNDDDARTDFIRFCLEKHQPGITSAEAREIQAEMTLKQFSTIAVFAVTGRLPEEIAREAATEGEPPSRSTGT